MQDIRGSDGPLLNFKDLKNYWWLLLSQSTLHQLWNGVAQNHKDQFWWHLAEVFEIP